MNPDEAAVAALEQHVNPDEPAQDPSTPAAPPEPAKVDPAPAEPAKSAEEAAKPADAQPDPNAAKPTEGEPAAPAATDETPEDIDWTQFLPQATKVEAPKPDENGQVDVQDYINYTLNQKLQDQANELRGWQQATKVLPDIANNPQLREFVHNQRLASVASGGNGDLAEAAKTVKAIFGQATAQGKAQATASVQVQTAAALETGGSATPPADDPKQRLADRINQGDSAAVQELLADWIDQGEI